MIGIQIATVPLLLINADINEHTALTVTINRLSVLARKEFPIFSPIFLAIPVSKSAALTTHIPTTIGQPVALNPLYTADSSISGINIAIATEPRIATTLIGSLFQTNKPIVINTIIIEIILESILYPPIYFYFKPLPSQHPSISRAHILTCRLHMATFYLLLLPDSP